MPTVSRFLFLFLLGINFVSCAGSVRNHTDSDLHVYQIKSKDSGSVLYGFRDSSDRIVVPAVYLAALDFQGKAMAAVLDRKKGWIYIDTYGEQVISPLVVDNGPDYFSEGLSRFRRDGKIGFFNEYGKIVIEPKFDFAWPFKNGKARYCNGCREKKVGEHISIIGGSFGYIDRRGIVVSEKSGK